MRPQEFVTRKGEAFDVLFPFRELTLICTVLGTYQYKLGTGLPCLHQRKTGVYAGFSWVQDLFRLVPGTPLAAELARPVAGAPVLRRPSTQVFPFGSTGCTAM